MLKDVIRAHHIDHYIDPNILSLIADKERSVAAWQIMNLFFHIVEAERLEATEYLEWSGELELVEENIQAIIPDIQVIEQLSQADRQQLLEEKEALFQRRAILLINITRVRNKELRSFYKASGLHQHLAKYISDLATATEDLSSTDAVFFQRLLDMFPVEDIGLHQDLKVELEKQVKLQDEVVVEPLILEEVNEVSTQKNEPDFIHEITVIIGKGKLPNFKREGKYSELLPRLLEWAKDYISFLALTRNIDLPEDPSEVIYNNTFEELLGTSLLDEWSNQELLFIKAFGKKVTKNQKIKWTIREIEIMAIIIEYERKNWGGGGETEGNKIHFINNLNSASKNFSTVAV